MKIKNNIKHFNVIYVLVVFLLFALMPITISSTAEGEYQISDEQTLKNWLQDSGSLQTNNPNAVLTTDITLNWGSGCPLWDTGIDASSTLDGNGRTIYIQSGSFTVGEGDYKANEQGMFVTNIYGTLKNTNFRLNGDWTGTIHSDTSYIGNESIFTGLVAAQIVGGTVGSCNVYIDHNITWTTQRSLITGKNSNHFGVIAGRVSGASVIKNVSVSQSSNTTITVTTVREGACYMRIGMIASDCYMDGSSNVPQITNVSIERWGNLVIRNGQSSPLSQSGGNYIYGIVVADMSTNSDNDVNHAVHINGVIYNGVSDVAWGSNDQIDFGRYTDPDFSFTYFVGRYVEGSGRPIFSDPNRFTIQNVYTYVTLTNESTLQREIGASLIPSGYTASFNANSEGQIIFTKNNAGTNDFIYSISQTESATTFNTYLQLSSSVTLDKFNTAASVGMDTISILDGTKVDNASFGFQYDEVTYNGLAHTAIFEVNEQIITEGFTVKYENNINSTVTNNGALATCTFEHPDTPEGIFLHSTRQYVANEAIDLTYYQEMTILQAPLSLTYTGSNIYDNNLAISGLVNNEQLTINGTKYSNGDNFKLDALAGDSEKVISFTDGVIETNYDIEYSGIENKTFTVSPKEITLDEGISVVTDGSLSEIKEGKLYIYSPSYKEMQLSFAQEEGYLNRVIVEAGDKNYNITSSLNDTTMSYTILPLETDDFQYITKLTLNQSLTKVALKFVVNDKVNLSSLTVNDSNVYKFGNYFAFDIDYGSEAIIKVEAKEGFNIQILVNGEEVGESGIATLTAKGDENFIMEITINIVAGA